MAETDNSRALVQLAGLANDGFSEEDEATATRLCGTVELAFVGFHLLPAWIRKTNL